MDLIQERDGSNNVIASYVRDGNIGGVLSRTTSSGTYYYHYDGNGNVVAMTNGSGATVAEYTYDAYGNLTSMSGSQAADNPIRFSTKYFDGDTDYYDFGFRSYDPVTGRWLNRDPIGEEGGLNLYGFAGNSPGNSLDTYGLVASVVINSGNKITIYLPIIYKGKGATPIQKLFYDRAIERWWTGKFGDYYVTTKVVHGPFNSSKDQWNVVEIPDSTGRQYVKNHRFGVWFTNRWDDPEREIKLLEWTIAHEAGHLMGLPDYYKDKGGASVVCEGYHGNIMAEVGGHVWGDNIKRIMEFKDNKIIR